MVGDDAAFCPRADCRGQVLVQMPCDNDVAGRYVRNLRAYGNTLPCRRLSKAASRVGNGQQYVIAAGYAGGEYFSGQPFLPGNHYSHTSPPK